MAGWAPQWLGRLSICRSQRLLVLADRFIGLRRETGLRSRPLLYVALCATQPQHDLLAFHQAGHAQPAGLTAMDSSYRDYGFTGFDKAVVVDVETTGLDPRKDRIVSIACLRGSIAEFATKGSTHLDQFTARLNPGIPIPREATRVHGIKNCDVAAEETFADVAMQ